MVLFFLSGFLLVAVEAAFEHTLFSSGIHSKQMGQGILHSVPLIRSTKSMRTGEEIQDSGVKRNLNVDWIIAWSIPTRIGTGYTRSNIANGQYDNNSSSQHQTLNNSAWNELQDFPEFRIRMKSRRSILILRWKNILPLVNFRPWGGDNKGRDAPNLFLSFHTIVSSIRRTSKREKCHRVASCWCGIRGREFSCENDHDRRRRRQ